MGYEGWRNLDGCGGIYGQAAFGFLGGAGGLDGVGWRMWVALGGGGYALENCMYWVVLMGWVS